jgi:hypothetical protein
LLLRVASEGDYEQVAVLAEWAQRLREITAQAGPAKGTSGALSGINGQTQPRTHSPVAAPSASANRSPERRKTGRRTKSTAKQADYPRFHRDRDELVKIGWSKKKKAEYCHKAPWPVVRAVVKAIEAKGAIGDKFDFEQLLPICMESGSEVPSYQSYLVLAWLRHERLITRHGRQGYSVSSDVNLPDIVQERWNLLPKS